MVGLPVRLRSPTALTSFGAPGILVCQFADLAADGAAVGGVINGRTETECTSILNRELSAVFLEQLEDLPVDRIDTTQGLRSGRGDIRNRRSFFQIIC